MHLRSRAAFRTSLRILSLRVRLPWWLCLQTLPLLPACATSMSYHASHRGWLQETRAQRRIESVREWTRSMRRMTRTRSYSHEARFCNCVSSGLRRRIHAELCTRRRWARIWSWRACTKSDHTVGSIPAAQRHFPKPHSGAAPGTFAGTRHQRAVGAKPVWRRYVSASAGQSSSDCAELLAARRCVGGSACVT
jgi:hypothetical protein